jgi:hypothetical protein
MDWGDAPAWAAFFASVGAVIVSLKARGDGRRAANAAEQSVTEAKRSADASEQSVVEARRSSDAAEVSARVAEETLADQRREAAERRAAEEEANRPRAVLRVEHRKKSSFEIVNAGDAPAENIRCLNRTEAVNRLPESFSLEPGEGQEFSLFSGGWGLQAPTSLKMVWDGQDEPKMLRVPAQSD